MINEAEIGRILEETTDPSDGWVRDIVQKAREAKGLTSREAAVLLQANKPELQELIFEAAREVKENIYGPRIVIFAPMYISSECVNNCLYCAFRRENTGITRRTLELDEIRAQTEILVRQGHKRILMVAGEHPKKAAVDYVMQAVETIYDVKVDNGNIRRVNVNMAPLSVEDFRKLKTCGIGTYQVFQETYHRESYKRLHPSGPKADYDWRITAMDRAQEAGIDDVGVGPLFGLYDHRFETIALLMHAEHLDRKFGCGPHTISVPRIEPATNVSYTDHPDYPVTDEDFKRIVGRLLLAVPYTGIILSTRESAEMRNEMMALGVSQISAGSRTDPGGYNPDEEHPQDGQFITSDHRSLSEVIYDLIKMGYLPSFCTACYRAHRTGVNFMELAKPGEIKEFCQPNALCTFKEYLLDFADDKTRRAGEDAIREHSRSVTNEKIRKTMENRLEIIEKEGKRDLFF
jgi:2-iminoacetate synthase